MKGKVLELSKNHLTPVASKLFPVRGRPRSEECAVGLYSQYKTWVMKNLPDYMRLHRLRAEQQDFRCRPTVSIVMSVGGGSTANTIESIDSVLGQLYENWELNILVSSSRAGVAKSITGFTNRHRNIRITSARKGELEADAINRLVDGMEGDYVAFLGQEDVLWPNALHEVVKALNEDRGRDFVYTDEDQIPDDRHDHVAPFLKPDWSPELLQSINYVMNFLVVKRSLYVRVGGLKLETGEACWWDLSFRLTRAATVIYHVPKILYSKRLHLDRGEGYERLVAEGERKMLRDHIELENSRVALEKNGEIWTVTHTPIQEPLVSIVIPTKNQYKVLKRCIESIFDKTLYSNFEIILVDTGSTDRRVLRFYGWLARRHSNLRVVNWHEQPFSYSRSCNEGVRHAKGEVVVMLNNDTEVVDSSWLSQLSAEASRPGVGAVGPLLLYMDGVTVQHAGVGVGLGGVAANLLSGLDTTRPMTRSQHIMLHARRNVSAVTGACLAIKRDIFEEVGGFDESFPVTYNDVDLCLKLVEKGYMNIYTPGVRMKHHESLTLGVPGTGTDRQRDLKEFEDSRRQFIGRWGEYVDHDPFVSRSVDKTTAVYDMRDT